MNNTLYQSLATVREENGLYEYLLVAHPDGIAYDKIMQEKKKFYGDFDEKVAVKTQPHITVASFLASEAMEPTIVKWMQRICSAQHGFQVMLHNYSGFPPHTIYLQVQDPLPFQQLAMQLKTVDDFIRASACPPAKLITRPHLSIARRLPEDVYNRAMAVYTQKTFDASFMLTELVLLRRSHQFDACKKIQVFRLKPVDDQPTYD